MGIKNKNFQFVKPMLILVCSLIQTTLISNLSAQSGSCAVGSYVNLLSFIDFTGSTSGDMEVTTDGSVHLGPNGIYDIYGAIDNQGAIIIDNGGVLNVYGDMLNSGSITVSSGGRINFYGEDWSNTSSASVVGTGDIYFTSIRPTISNDWLIATPCISAYSAGSFSQDLDGGGTGVDMDIRLFVNNANNVILTGTTSISGSLNFNMNNGDVLLGDNDLVMTTAAAVNSFNPTRFAVTNGTGHMVKEGLASAGYYFFPIGRAEGDYTPATIINDAGAADIFHTQVKNYSESASDEFDPSRGMDRTWNIFSDNGSGATLVLQHNSSTNHVDDYTTKGGDPAAFVTQYLGQMWEPSSHQMQGEWEIGTGGLNTYAAGTVPGSSSHTRSYGITATSSVANAAFFSKSSNVFAPLPVKLLSFDVCKAGVLKSNIEWSTVNEVNIKGFEVQRFNMESKDWEFIAWMPASGQGYDVAKYDLMDNNAKYGVNLYRLKIISRDEKSEYSETKTVEFNHAAPANFLIFPNPVDEIGVLHLVGNSAIKTLVITDALGREVLIEQTESSNMAIDVSRLAKGVYTIHINGNQYQFVR